MDEEIRVGDIVKQKGLLKEIIYIVVDIEDYSITAGNYISSLSNVICHVMQIYPVKKFSNKEMISRQSLILVESKESPKYDFILSFVKRERERNNWFSEPDWHQAINRRHNTRDYKPTLKLAIRERQANYNTRLKTIDDCLDALNDLKYLQSLPLDTEEYDVLEDINYEEVKEIIYGRLRVLLQLEGDNKKKR